MELIDNLSDEWKSVEPTNVGEGFVEFVISHRAQCGDGSYKYSILEAADGAPRAPVLLSGISSDRDPLKGIQHVMLKLRETENKPMVVGIQVGSERVVKKN